MDAITLHCLAVQQPELAVHIHIPTNDGQKDFWYHARCLPQSEWWRKYLDKMSTDTPPAAWAKCSWCADRWTS